MVAGAALPAVASAPTPVVEEGKKMKVEETVMKECARIKELLRSLYTALGLEPPQVV
jgi:hypothetical protein